MSDSQDAWQQMVADLKQYEAMKKSLQHMIVKYCEISKAMDTVDTCGVVEDLQEVLNG